MEAASYGRLDVEFTPLHEWIRLPHVHTHYVATNVAGYDTVGGQVYQDAVRIADTKFDFSGQDAVMVVFPSSLFSGGEARLRGSSLSTSEGKIVSGALVNVYMAWWVAEEWYARDEPKFWGGMAVHELLHVLGLPDYYSYDARWFPHEPKGFKYDTSRFGPMGLTVQSLHPDQEPRYGPSTREMLAWSRYQLQWLDHSKLRCVTDEGHYELSSLVNLESTAIGMLAIPLNDTTVVIVQSVRWDGFDTPCTYSQIRQKPFEHYCNFVGGSEGVLIYIVDTSIPAGSRPIRVAGEDSDGVVHRSPLLVEGQGVVVDRYEIRVVASSETIHGIQISKSQ